MMLQYLTGMVQSGCWALFDDTDRLSKGQYIYLSIYIYIYIYIYIHIYRCMCVCGYTKLNLKFLFNLRHWVGKTKNFDLFLAICKSGFQIYRKLKESEFSTFSYRCKSLEFEKCYAQDALKNSFFF